MKASDRVLAGIVAGIVLLVALALVLTLTRPPADYQPEDTPAGVTNNYLLALLNEEHERAYGYLSPQIKCYPSSVSEFSDAVRSYAYIFGASDQGRSWSVENTTVGRWSAAVKVSEPRFRGGGLFETGQTYEQFQVDLVLEDEGWRIISADRYFAKYQWTSANCKWRRRAGGNRVATRGDCHSFPSS
jgi:hypothetical protein